MISKTGNNHSPLIQAMMKKMADGEPQSLPSWKEMPEIPKPTPTTTPIRQLTPSAWGSPLTPVWDSLMKLRDYVESEQFPKNLRNEMLLHVQEIENAIRSAETKSK